MTSAALFWIVATMPAAAHGPAAVPPEMLWRSWNADPLVLTPVLLFTALYARGLRNLWARAGLSRGLSYGQAASFALGIAALVVALVSPLDPLGETLLSAHMAQHALLVAVAPPLLLLGQPGAAFAWALPAASRKRLLGSAAWKRLSQAGNVLSRPLPAAVLHGLALWIWHAPAAFDAAAEGYWLHAAEHACFFGTAILFWRAVLAARSPRSAVPALMAAFATLMHGGFLGALLTLAPDPLYAWYEGRTELWGMAQIEDQQLAGLLMWVPMGLVYFGACLFLAGRLVGLGGRPSHEIERARAAIEGGVP